jgi:CRISPR-associated protein Csx17
MGWTMNTIHVHELTGLKPEALATYLTALGVLRLIAEQHDPQVRGFWRDEHFVLVTKSSWADIETFFLKNYSPSPILAPWNLEGGFFSFKPGRDASARRGDAPDEDARGDLGTADGRVDEEQDETEQAAGDPLLDAFAESEAPRFAAIREAIVIARDAIPEKLRRAEEELRRVHEEVWRRSESERAELERVRAMLTEVQALVAEAKRFLEEQKAAQKGARSTSDARAEVVAAEQRLREVQRREKEIRRQERALRASLREAERRAKNDRESKARIAEKKKWFKDVQGSTKERLLADLRARWGPRGQQWIDAVSALDETGSAAFAPLFGSGGNDGRMEFTKHFRSHLQQLFDVDCGEPRENAAAKLRAVLIGGATTVLSCDPVGQFYPGRAGGTNMGVGFGGEAGVNSWEFILMLEGAVALVTGMSRRGEVGRARISSPFWVEAAGAGFGSACEREELLRGEQWLPVWSQPATYDELSLIFREARAQVGREQAKRAGELVRATARLGLARGIESLQRFSYLKRNGQSNLAVFTGRYHVRSRWHQELLDEVAPWIEDLVRCAKSTKQNNVPASLARVAKRVQDALFDVCRKDTTPTDWRALLIALGEAELVLLRSGKDWNRRPIPPLNSKWIDAIDDRTVFGRRILRLALAFASQHGAIEFGRGQIVLRDPIRRHFMPLEATRAQEARSPEPRFKLDSRGRPVEDPEHVCMGRDLVADAIALLERRSVWARRSAAEGSRASGLPLRAVGGYEATLEEVAAWVRGEVRDEDVLGLVRPLLALDWVDLAGGRAAIPPAKGGAFEPLHLLFRLVHLPFDLPVADATGHAQAGAAVTIRLDPEPLRRLAGGDLDGALRIAVRRLEASGLRPALRRAVATRAFSRRLAASLAFPISQRDAALAARLVCKPYTVKAVEEQQVLSV